MIVTRVPYSNIAGGIGTKGLNWHARSRMTYAAQCLAMAACGAGIGYASWLNIQYQVLLLLLPVLANIAGGRWGTFFLAVGYFGAGNIELPSIITTFFGTPPLWMTWPMPALLTVIESAPFLVYTPRARPWRRMLAWGMALTILSVPPVGFFAWRNPLVLAGSLYPGLGLAGLVLTLLLFAGLAGVRGPRPSWRLAVPVVVFLVSGATIAIVGQRVSPGRTVNWAAVDTHHLPPGDTPAHQTSRTAKVVSIVRQVAQQPWPRVVIMGESTLHPLRPVDQVMMFPVSDAMAKRGQALVIGAIINTGPHTWRNVTLGGGTLALQDGRFRVLDESRIPMPLGDWHVWFPGGVPIHPFRSDYGRLDGIPVAWSICYEDTLIWPHPALLSWQTRAMVSLSNDWSLPGTRAARAQKISAEQLARMAHVPLVTATNY